MSVVDDSSLPLQLQRDFYLLVQPWGVYVKDADAFQMKGGQSEIWGKRWVKVQANSLSHAREIGEEKRKLVDEDSYLHARTAETRGYSLGR